LDAFNERLLTATRDWEPRHESNAIENTARRARGESISQIEDPTRTLYQDRREMGAQFIERLKALLGNDVFGTLDGARRFMPRSAETTPGQIRQIGHDSKNRGAITSGGRSLGAGKDKDRSEAGRDVGQQKPGGGSSNKDR
jgi:hypothetical protein